MGRKARSHIDIYRLMTVVVVGAWIILSAIVLITLFTKGCTYGDRAQGFVFDNRRDEVVTVTDRYDNEGEEGIGLTLPPRSVTETHFMIESKGVQIRATSASGVVLLDRHYVWEEIRGDKLTIVIE